MTLISIVTGPPRFHGETPWRWWTAGLATLGIMVLFVLCLAAFVGAGLFMLLGQSSFGISDFDKFLQSLSVVQWAVVLSIAGVMAQGLGVMVVWQLSSAGGARQVLSLAAAPFGLFGHVVIALSVVLLLGAFAAGLTAAFPYTGSVQPIQDFIKSDDWWIAIMPIAVGAPLFEEVLFRGFLFTAIVQSRLGAVGAILITTVIWALFHTGYVWQEMVIVGTFGFVLGWLVWQIGSIWPGVLCHAAWNFGVLIAARWVV